MLESRRVVGFAMADHMRAELASKIHPTSEADAERALGGSQMPSRAPGDVRA
jgi:hypothetical protein